MQSHLSVPEPASGNLLAFPASGEGGLELTLLMPCLDEARTIGACVDQARAFLASHGIEGEVLVADNGSRDGSREIARSRGARVVEVSERGYGAALAGGIAAAEGRYVIMGDADGSYDWSAILPFLERLRAGSDVVVGNRFRGEIRPGAMPFLHRFLGNPVLSAVGRRLFGSECGDFYCGQRGFARVAALRMDLRSSGMEFALEMLVRAELLGMIVTEVPITLSPDGRGRRSHLRTWRDGWRSLRLFFLYAPRWLFLYPGLALLLGGSALGAWCLAAPGPFLSVPALLYGGVATCAGFQLVLLAFLAKVLALVSGLHPQRVGMERVLARLDLEHGLFAGGSMALAGLAGSAWSLLGRSGVLDIAAELRAAVPWLLLLALGCQVLGASLYFGMLALEWRERFRPLQGARQWSRRQAA